MCETLEQQFRAFRATHAACHREIAGVAWRCFSCGQGDEALLLLPGAPGLGETSFQSIARWESRYRIIAPVQGAQDITEIIPHPCHARRDGGSAFGGSQRFRQPLHPQE